MNRLVLALALLLTIIVTPARAETISLTLDQALNVLNGLSALDSYDKVVKEGAVEKVVKASYNLKGGVRLAIGRDIVQLRTAVQSLQQATQSLRLQFISEGKLKLTPDGKVEGSGLDELNKQTQDMLNQKQDFELYKLKPSELQLDDNPIPGTVLAAISPILEDK